MKKKQYKCKKCELIAIVVMADSLDLRKVECQDCGTKTMEICK